MIETVPQPAAAKRRPLHAAARPETVTGRLGRVSLATWFLWIATVIGVFVVFAQPPGQGLDETNHFYRVWALSEGHLVAPSEHARAGGQIPDCIPTYLAHFQQESTAPGPFHLSDYWSTPTHCTSSSSFAYFENTAINSPIAYAGPVIAVAILRHVGASLPLIFFGGRLAGLLTYIAICYAAIRIAPRGRALMFVLALLPESVTIASGYSEDAMTIALALLAVAVTLRVCTSPGATRRAYLAMVASLVVAALSKSVLVLLLALLVFVPSSALPPGRGRWRWLAGGAAVVVVPWLMWTYAVRNISYAAYSPLGPGFHIDKAAQESFILHHPASYLKVMARTLFDSSSQTYPISGFFGEVGFWRPTVHDDNMAPMAVVLVGSLTIFYAYLMEMGARLTDLTRAQRLLSYVPLILPVAALFIIETTFWVFWTPVGLKTIIGVQGRYLVPFAAVPLIAVCLTRAPSERAGRVLPLVLASSVLLAWLVAKITLHDFIW